MIKLGDLLKVIELDGPTLCVAVQFSSCDHKYIRDSRIAKYLDREVINIVFDTENVDYYYNYHAGFYVYVTIEGPLLNDDM